MSTHEAFLNELDEARIVAAIAQAESRSSGEIRVFVSQSAIKDPLGQAEIEFKRLNMHKTDDRNGVLLFFAPVTRKFAIVGDQGIHARCGHDFWRAAAVLMEDHLKAGRPTDAAVDAIHRIGEVLAAHFPRRHNDRNELPDSIERG